MSSTIDRMLGANENARRTLRAAMTEIAEGPRKSGREFSPEAIIKWFFTWTLCVVGFMAAMTVLTTLGKLAKLLVP